MTAIMKLHHRLHHHLSSKNSPVLLIHGLFGNLDNLGVLARELHADRSVLSVDLRDHGLSPHSSAISYSLMAQDIICLLDELALPCVTVIGHSMGGKVAMRLAAMVPERIDKLVVLDIAPVPYHDNQHAAVFNALHAVTESGITQRRDAISIMRKRLKEESTIQFLLKSFHEGQWRFNVAALQENYQTIMGWETQPPCMRPTLFLKGERSFYILEAHRSAIVEQFPNARAHIIAGTGHWLHAEKPVQVWATIQRFLSVP
jgi:esterase